MSTTINVTNGDGTTKTITLPSRDLSGNSDDVKEFLAQETVMDFPFNVYCSSGTTATIDIDGHAVPSSVDVAYLGATTGNSLGVSFSNAYVSNPMTLIYPDSVTRFGNSTFQGSSVDRLYLTSKITAIGNNVYKSTNSLYTVVLPDTLTSIGTGCFESSLVQSFTLGNTLTAIPDKTLKSCFLLSTIDISNATSIGDEAFMGTSFSTIDLSNIVTIGEKAFKDNYNLNNVDLSSCTAIGDYAFDGVYNSSPTFGEGLLTLGEYAFYNNYTTATLDIPSTVTYIGDHCFDSNYDATSVKIRATTPPTLGGSNVFSNMFNTTQILVPTSALSAYGGAGASFGGLTVTDGQF